MKHNPKKKGNRKMNIMNHFEHCGCGKHKEKENANMPKFFLAVCDVTEKFGRLNEEMEICDTYRYFNDKFVDSPETALLIMFDDENLRWKADPAVVMNGVYYSEETGEYIRVTTLTRDRHLPNFNQLNKIMSGEYECIRIEERVQVFQTNLISCDKLIQKSILNWRAKKHSPR